jgi:hypothetical protein
VFWNDDLTVDVLGYSQYHIDLSIKGLGEIPWRLTSIYGKAKTNKRYRTCNMMKDICTHSSLSWLCIGHFNEVL